MPEKDRKLKDKLEALQYVAADAEAIPSWSMAYEERKLQTLGAIADELPNNPALVIEVKRYIASVAHYRTRSGFASFCARFGYKGLIQARWRELNRNGLSLDDALDPVEELLGMDIKLGDMRGPDESHVIMGESKAEPTKKGEVEIFASDLIPLLTVLRTQ